MKFLSLKELARSRNIAVAIILVAILAITPYLARISSQITNEIIGLEFFFADSVHDPENDGKEMITGVVDLGVNAQFPFDYNETYVATKYEIYSKDDDLSTIICYGSDIACAAIELIPTETRWNDELYLYFGKNSATSDNIVGAQIIYVDYNSSAQNPYENIFTSQTKSLPVKFIDYPNTAITSIKHDAKCIGCKAEKILQNSEVNFTIFIFGNTSNVNLTYIVPFSWERITPLSDYGYNETHDALTFSLYGIDQLQESFLLKAPSEMGIYSFKYSVLDFEREFFLEVTNSISNIPPKCVFEKLKINKNSNATIPLNERCSDEELNEIFFSITNSQNAQSYVENSRLAIIPFENFTGFGFVELNSSDQYSHSMSIVEFEVAAPIEPQCMEIPNITMRRNSNYSLNLSPLCSDPRGNELSFSIYNADEFEAILENDIAIIKPTSDFIGTLFSFIEAQNEFASTFSNTFRIDVVENSFTEKLEQLPAEVEKPVKWKKTLQYEFEAENATLEIPAEAENISVIDEGIEIDDSEVIVELDGKLDTLDKFENTQSHPKISGLLFFKEKEEQEENITLTVKEIKDLEVLYETEAPAKDEEQLNPLEKRITISSELHYENVLASTNIPESRQDSIKLYWIINGTREVFNDVTYLDTNSNGLVDKIEWVVPHLSNQTFEVDLSIIDVQSYPFVGGSWVVRFNTKGSENLTISALDGTAFSELEIDDPETVSDLKISELKCGNTIFFDYKNEIISPNVFILDLNGQKLKIEDTLNSQIPIKSLFVEDFNCDNQTAFWTVDVLTQGKHSQRFDFGSLSAFANNYALNGFNFSDDTTEEFGLGTFHHTNTTGVGAAANVTLNYTTINGMKRHNTTGNFTSRIFDSGQNHTVWDKIAWTPYLMNSSDIIGYALDSGSGTMAVFYRNGSMGVDTAQANLNGAAISFTGALRRYTLPAGWDASDIIEFAMDDDGTSPERVYALFKNGSTLETGDVTTLNADITFAETASTWILTPQGFNLSEIIGFEIDSGATQAAIFFRNLSQVVAAAENAPFTFSTVSTFSIPTTYDINKIEGIAMHTGANDIAVLHRNGSWATDTAQANLLTILMTAERASAAYQADANRTETTNITLQTRVANDTSLFSPWSSPYTESESADIAAINGRYIQYKAVFTTIDPWVTPHLENVSLNYSKDLQGPFVNASLNNTSPRYSDVVNFTANASDESGLQICQFILNQSAGGAKQFYNVTTGGRNSQCSQNFTISMSKGNVVNFTVLVNDSYGNINRTEHIITLTNYPPFTPSIVFPQNDIKTRKQPLDINVTVSDIDGDLIIIGYYINGLINTTSSSNVTFNATEGIYTLNVSAFDGAESSQNATINFTLDLTSPVANGTLNKSSTIRIFDVINATFNFTDNLGIDSAQIITNISGNMFHNFSFYGKLSGEFSQNFTILCGRGCVINITGRVNDTAGNIKQNSTIFEVANTAPFDTQILIPYQNEYSNDQPQQLNVTFEADLDNDPLTIRYYIDGIINTSGSSNTTFNATDGYYILNASLFDGFGSGPNSTVNFTIDTKNPGISLVYPQNATFNSSGLLQMLYTPNDINLQYCILYTNFSGIWRKNQTEIALNNGALNSFNTTAYDNGVFAWNVYCNDSAGNSAFNLTNYTITVDTIKPKINFSYPTPANGSNLSSASQIFNVTHTDSNPEVLIFSINATLPNESMRYSNEPNYTNLTRTNLHGIYSFYFWANDSASNYNQTETRVVNIDSRNPSVNLEAPGNNTWNNSATMVFSYNTYDDFLGTKNCTLYLDKRANSTNTTIVDLQSQNFTVVLNNTFGINWSINCTDFAGNTNLTAHRILKIDTEFPRINNESINDTSIAVNEPICLNVTVNDSWSEVQAVIVERMRPVSGLTNISLTNDSANPNSCSGFGRTWSYKLVASEEGEVNWTSTYVIDYAGNINMSHTFGLNWSQTANIFLNSTKLFPLVNFVVNESDLDLNYTFAMSCNATCRQDSSLGCDDVTIFPQYFNDSWNDINNFSSQLKSNAMNYSCGNLAIGEQCNSSFIIRTSTFSGGENYTLRCRAKGANTPNDYSNETNTTVNDHPEALFYFPPNTKHIRGIININSSASSDDRNISRYLVLLDDNIGFSSPISLCDTNESNCTFSTQAQSQCIEDTPNCFLMLNLTDSDNLKNSTPIQIQIDNTMPSVRLDFPANDTRSTAVQIDFRYTAFDSNLSTCSLYHNESGIWEIGETNETVKNNTQDTITKMFSEGFFAWNIGCNDTAGNLGFNSTNYTLLVDIQNPRINYTTPTLANKSYQQGNYILVNVSLNESNLANITFYLYNSDLQLVNETNFSNFNTFVNFSNLADMDEVYYYNVTARDRAANQNSTETLIITLDNTKPRINFTFPTAANNSHFNRNYIYINVTSTETNFQNITFYLYNSLQQLVNATTINESTNPTNFSLNFSNLADLDEVYYYNVSLIDKVGLINSTEKRQVTLDNLTPSVRLNSPANGTLTSNASILFNFTAFDSNLKNCTLYANFSTEFKENETNTSPDSGQNILISINLTDGFYSWNARCFDFAGNNEFNSSNYTIEIDRTQPGSFDLDQPPSGTESQNRSPILNWSEALEPHFANYTVWVDNFADFSSIDFVYKLGGNASNNTFAVPDQWAGNMIWYWKVSAFDLVNLSFNSSVFNYTIDNGTPQINLTSPANWSLQTGTVVSFTFNVTDTFSVANCTLILNDLVMATSSEITKNVTNIISFSPANGDYNWSINCTDRAGNVNSSPFRNITVNSPSLLPTKFIDTTNVDFNGGVLHKANVTGAGQGSNVSLNYSTNRTFRVYQYNGNFTSRVFDTGADNAIIERIKWTATLKNSSDVLGFIIDSPTNDYVVFYRNGSKGLDNTQTDFNTVPDYAANGLQSYTIPAGFDYNDIIGFGMDEDGSDRGDLFTINHTVLSTADLAAGGMLGNVAFTSTISTWSITPSGFNATDVIGIAMDTSANAGTGEVAMFFKNLSFVVVEDEAPPHAFVNVRSFTLPAGFSTENIIGVQHEDGAGQVGLFYANGTILVDTSQADFSTDVDFTTTTTATYNANFNITKTTNITIQTRASNDSVTFTPWSSIYSDFDGSPLDSRLARYVQYKAVLDTYDQYITPDLENVTVNYSETNNPRINFTNITPINNSFLNVDYIFINTSIYDEHSTEKCTIEFDGANESTLISREGRNASCYINKTSISEGRHGFRVYANDSFGNTNSTEIRNITIDLTAPVELIFTIDPNPARFTIDNVSINFTAFDIYLNSTAVNVSYPNRTTLSAYNLNFNLTIVNITLPGNYSIALFANDTAGNVLRSTKYLIVNDVTVPNVSLVLPLNNTFTNNRTVRFYYNPKDDYNVSNCTLILNNMPNVTNQTIAEAISNNFTLILPDGEYNWSVNCTDSYMNINGSEYNRIVIDTTPPNMTLNFPANDFNSSEDILIFNWSTIDMFDINVTCNLTINGAMIIHNITNATGFDINYTAVNLTEGANLWNVTCYDDLNNTNTSITKNFTIVKGPALLNISLMSDNESINLTWISVSYAESYGVFVKNTFDEDFGPVANYTTRDTNYTDYNANQSTKYYKIATLKGITNKTSIRTLGKQKIELINNSESTSDWNLISIPFNITNFLLNNGTNNGTDLRTPYFCIKALWFYNSTTQEFKATEYNGSAWIPAADSDNFTSLRPGVGYWAEVNRTCNLTFVGEVPTGNVSIELETGFNLVGFYSSNSSRLPTNFANPYPVVVDPANSIKAINRYNAANDNFEVTIHFTVSGEDWGWFPSSSNREFTSIEPARGYYYDVLNTATWKHKPVERDD